MVAGSSLSEPVVVTRGEMMAREGKRWMSSAGLAKHRSRERCRKGELLATRLAAPWA